MSEEKKKYKKVDFEFGRLLGDGAYGRVYLVTLKETGQVYAAKVVEKQLVIANNKLKSVMTEKAVLNKLKHDNIVRLMCTFQDEDHLYFVLELATRGEILEYINDFGALSEEAARFYIAELICAVGYMHSVGVLHRDIKPENVLLDEKMHVKLTDFGTALLAEEQDEEVERFVGTAEYVSPEVLNDEPCNEGSDLWAVGCVLYQFLFGVPPFKAESEYLTFQKIINLEYSFPEVPQVSSEAVDVIKKLLVTDPEERIGYSEISELQEHPFFAGLDFEKLNELTPPPIVPEGKHMPNIFEKIKKEEEEEEKRRQALIAQKLHPETDKWAEFLVDGEKLLHTSPVVKHRKLTAKKRQLILTDKPRLFYVDSHKREEKGEIPLTRDTWLEMRSDRNFTVHTPGRNYVLEDLNEESSKWVDFIVQVKNKL